MNYKETIDYLFGQLPMYQRQGKAAYKANLDNTWALMDLLKHPYKNFKSIHVGGTNGKGSTSHMLASVLQEQGYKVGLYTSPHLVDFRERIKINGQLISEAKVVEFVEQYRAQFEAINLSFFEWTVGLAFHYFAQQKVDVAIVEVGLGGRLDSTNVINPMLSIITNIGLDHTQFLGDTHEKIAQEKAGIIKQNTPVIIGETTPETKAVFWEVAQKQNAPITFCEDLSENNLPTCDLKGSYQKANIKTANEAIKQLIASGITVSEEAIKTGFNNVVKNTGLLGRWQIIQRHPQVICDTGHNNEGVEHLVNQLKEISNNQLHIVWGMVNDKNIESVIQLLPKTANYYFTQASIPRALAANKLQSVAQKNGLQGEVYDSVKKAYKKALEKAQANDLVFVGGSTFVVADFLVDIG